MASIITIFPKLLFVGVVFESMVFCGYLLDSQLAETYMVAVLCNSK
jgi:hypothetical protein